ncbi:MAG: M48 family metalloprotease [Elusimicrobia bacterium]|nr:M48 family metalloprotease [Elusimicrobiota bacterium]
MTRALLAVVLALACPGQEAYAQAVRVARPAPSAGAAVFLPSAGLPSGALLPLAGAPLSAPALSPSLAAPSLDPAPRPAPVRAAAATPVPVAPKAAVPGAKALERRAAEAKERAAEQRSIDRVLKVSIALEKIETGGSVREEDLKVTADRAWSEAAPASPAAAAVPAAASSPSPVLPKASGAAPNKMNGPPPAPKPSLIRAKAKEGRLAMGRALDRAVTSVGSLSRRLPAPLVAFATGAATVGADLAARLLFPAVFGFTPAVGLWVVAGLGGVLIPALVATRIVLARKADPAHAPLTRYADGLLGVLAGAAAVTALGLTGLDLPAAMLGAAAKGAGLVSLAPLLGLFAFMAALPVVYGAGHTAWGLRNKTKIAPEFPVQLPFSLMLLPMLFSPMMRFLSLTGGVSDLLAFPLLFAAIAAYRLSVRFLTRMTAKGASPAAAAFSVRELLARWRLDRVPGEPTTPEAEIRRARVQSAWWGGALALGSLAVLSALKLSVPAALAAAGASLTGSLMTMAPMILLSGFAAALFMRVKRVRSGPYVETVRDLARRAKVPMPRVYAGETTGDPNAFAAGGVQLLSVVAVKGYLTRLMTVREMRGVLAHELSHVKYRHMLTLFASIACLQLLSGGAVTLLQMALGYWAPLLWMVGAMGLTRANERMADAGAARITGDPRALATGLRKFALLGVDDEKVPHREGSWLYRLLLSHPDPLERVRTLGRMVKKPD